MSEQLLRISDDGADAPDGRGHLSAATSNAEMFARIMALYARPGMTVVDPMRGPGVFWQQVDRGLYDAHITDISTGGPDARALPHADCSVDVVVLDPPYRYIETRTTSDKLVLLENDIYNLNAVRAVDGPKGFDAVMALYRDSMTEAVRALAVGGYLIVKCQDTITDGKQRWVHLDLMEHAEAAGAPPIDLAIVVSGKVPPTRWKRQRSLRKAHSYFLVCRKGGRWPFGYRATSKRKVRTDLEDAS